MEKYNNFSLQEGTLVTRTDTISSDHYLQLTGTVGSGWHVETRESPPRRVPFNRQPTDTLGATCASAACI